MPIESEDRLQRAIGGDPPDRVPVAPLLYYFAGVQAGMTCAELVSRPASYRAAMDHCWSELGPWDVYSPINAVTRDMMALAMPMKTAYPGDELPDDAQMQFLEEELMRPADYAWLLERTFPVGRRALRRAWRAELGAWRRGRSRTGAGGRVAATVAALQRNVPTLLRSHFGDRRDLPLELVGCAHLARALRRLLRDPELDGDLVLRYLGFVLRLAGRARGRAGVLDNLGACLRAAWQQYDFTRYDVQAWRSRGVATLYTIGMEGPFDALSMARSLVPFSTDDLFNRPDDIRTWWRPVSSPSAGPSPEPSGATSTTSGRTWSAWRSRAPASTSSIWATTSRRSASPTRSAPTATATTRWRAGTWPARPRGADRAGRPPAPPSRRRSSSWP